MVARVDCWTARVIDEIWRVDLGDVELMPESENADWAVHDNLERVSAGGTQTFLRTTHSEHACNRFDALTRVHAENDGDPVGADLAQFGVGRRRVEWTKQSVDDK